MHWLRQLEGRAKRNASRAARMAWLAFAALATGLAIPGIPRYHTLLQSPCDGTRCFAAQVTTEAAHQAGVAGNLRDFAFVQTTTVLVIGVPLAVTAIFLIWWKAHRRVSVLAAFVAMAMATSAFSQALAHTDSRFRFLAQSVLVVQLAGLPPLLCLLPDGEFRPRAARWVAPAYALASLLYLLPGVRDRLALAEGDAMPRPPTLELDIADDGSDLTTGCGEQGNGLGMLTMQARAAEVGGSCRVEAAPIGGTRIVVRIPIVEA